MSEITTQGCEREFRADERAEVQEERRFDERVRYAPRGPEVGEEFFRAALDLSNALGLLASGELNVAKLKDRMAVHQVFGNTENALKKAKSQFHSICIKARLAEDAEKGIPWH